MPLVGYARRQFSNATKEFTQLYSNGPVAKSGDATCIIMSNNPYKIIWDVLILFLLTFICFVVPYRLAFSDGESFGWQLTYGIIDMFFTLDILLTFFTSVSDNNNVCEITDKKFIAERYFKTWFFFDVLSVVPIDKIIASNENPANDANSLIRFVKIGKLYKLIRLTRLAKVLKLIKSQNSVMGHFS